MSLDFYYMPLSAPSRAVLMVAKYLDVPLNLRLTDLMKGEHKTPEFLKLNPAHCIPTLVDDGFALWESRPMLEYIAEKYGKGKLVPSDVKERATMRKLLSVDGTGLYSALGDYLYPQIFQKQPPNEEKKQSLNEKLELVDKILVGPYFQGDALTLADFSILASVTTLEVLDFDISEHKNLSAWVDRLKKEFPFYKEINGDGVNMLKKFIQG